MNQKLSKVRDTKMSYRIKIDAKSRAVAKYISALQEKIQAALVASGMTQQEVAEKLGVDRSVINRRLKGKANLTARSIAEFSYAFDKEVVTDFLDKVRSHNSYTITSDGLQNPSVAVQYHDNQLKTKGTIGAHQHAIIEKSAA